MGWETQLGILWYSWRFSWGLLLDRTVRAPGARNVSIQQLLLLCIGLASLAALGLLGLVPDGDGPHELAEHLQPPVLDPVLELLLACFRHVFRQHVELLSPRPRHIPILRSG